MTSINLHPIKYLKNDTIYTSSSDSGRYPLMLYRVRRDQDNETNDKYNLD